MIANQTKLPRNPKRKNDKETTTGARLSWPCRATVSWTFWNKERRLRGQCWKLQELTSTTREPGSTAHPHHKSARTRQAATIRWARDDYRREEMWDLRGAAGEVEDGLRRRGVDGFDGGPNHRRRLLFFFHGLLGRPPPARVRLCRLLRRRFFRAASTPQPTQPSRHGHGPTWTQNWWKLGPAVRKSEPARNQTAKKYNNMLGSEPTVQKGQRPLNFF